MNLYLFVVVLLVILPASEVSGSINFGSFDPVGSDDECNIINEKYWSTIEEFYGSINLISLYFIHPFKPKTSTFKLSSTLLEQLPKRLDCAMTYQVIDTECGCVKLSSSRLKFVNILKDYTDSGVLIIAENIYSIDKILLLLPQYLADVKRRKTIITIMNTTDPQFDSQSTDLLTKLWEKIRIANVMLITPCNYDSEVIRTYFPFEPFTYGNYTTWGVCRFLPMSNLSLPNMSLTTKLKNFNGFPLRISFFWRYPTSMKLNELSKASQNLDIMKDMWRSNNFTGIDGLLLASVVKTFNFTPILVKPSGAEFGYKAPDGKFLGTIGEVLSGRTYVSFIGHFINDYGTDEIEYIFPYFFDKLCIVAPKAPRIPEWMAIFQCYDLTVWFSLLIINTLCGWFWFMLKRTHASDPKERWIQLKKSRRNSSLGKAFIDMWFIMLSGPFQKLPHRKIERIFLATCLFSNVIFIGTFQSSLKTAFTTVTHFKDIHTLQELDRRGLSIGTSSGSLRKVFGSMANVFGAQNFSNPIIQSLKKKYILVNSTRPALDAVAYGNICCIERLTDVKVILSYKYRANDGSSPLHIIEECLRSFYLAYIVKKGSALQPSFSYHVQRLFEGGFVTFWYDYIEYAITTHRRYTRLVTRSDQESLSLIDLQIAFFILFIGLCFAFVLFIIEILVYNQRQTKLIKYEYIN